MRRTPARFEALRHPPQLGCSYVTPGGGAVLTPVAPIGLRARQAGTVSFTTSLGFGRKLERIARKFMGPPKTGAFGDRWLRVYYPDRVLVTVAVERVISWPDLACLGEHVVSGAPPPPDEPPP